MSWRQMQHMYMLNQEANGCDVKWKELCVISGVIFLPLGAKGYSRWDWHNVQYYVQNADTMQGNNNMA
uniref:Uncharacterized protein n=1 Tax=Anguilla anguilla TaxID=7936 RepID=A0A0E9X8C5_ANGAN